MLSQTVRLRFALSYLALLALNQESLAQESTPARVHVQGEAVASGQPAFIIAQVAPAETDRIIVRGRYDTEPEEYPALPEVEGTRINSGKKTNFVKPEDLPVVANNNYRELVATTPGVLVSEEPSSPIVNFGYRGYDSQRSEFTQLLKDGISVKNEQFGFPESHYVPILDSLERIEFIRGGSALQYGSQPGGAINFVTKMPRRDAPFHFETKNLWGTDELYQNYTAIDGTLGNFGYSIFYDHREREGFRFNSDYDLDNGSGKFVYDLSNDSRIIVTGDFYYEEHGEPGGLRRRGDPAGDPVIPPPGSSALVPAYYEDDRDQVTRLFDRFRLTRYYGTAQYQKAFSEATQFELTAFGGYLSRWSKRQRGGDFGLRPAPIFPTTAPTAARRTNTVQDRQVWNQGAETRLRHDYTLAGDTSTFTGGLYFYHALQERTDKRGATPDATDGQLRNLNFGETWNGAIFAENRFHFGRLSIVPGFRIEFLDTSLEEEINVAKVAVPLGDESDFAVVPLFGLGVSYVLLEGGQTSAGAPMGDPKDFDAKKSVVSPAVTLPGPPRLELFGNVSQGYRPRAYGELVPTSATGVANSNLEEGHSVEAEIGLRGRPLPYLKFEVSGFYIKFVDQIAELTNFPNPDPTGPALVTITDNVGDSRTWGADFSVQLDLLAALNGGSENPYGQFNLFGNVTYLDAEFTAGPANGKIPVYAPDYLFKTGAIYRWKDTVKVGLIGTIVDEHFADANNSYQRFIPSYQVWDLTAEVNFWKGRIGVFGGIGNLFDEDFYAEVRDEGIVPAYRRNYYGGIKIRF